MNRTGIAAGSPVPDETMRKLMSRMNLHELVITYGQTETVCSFLWLTVASVPCVLTFFGSRTQSPGTAMSSTTDPVDLRCRTVGRVMPHTHIRIVDTASPLYPAPETPSVPIGVPGELWSAGYQVQKGYWGNDAETKKVVFEEAGVRWMRTGDEAIMDGEGYISIVGRMKGALLPLISSLICFSCLHRILMILSVTVADIIIRGGENIFPVVVENRALLLPGIADCSCVPCPSLVLPPPTLYHTHAFCDSLLTDPPVLQSHRCALPPPRRDRRRLCAARSVASRPGGDRRRLGEPH